MAISPQKLASRPVLQPTDLPTSRQPESPEKTRDLRRFKSHSQLSSHQSTLTASRAPQTRLSTRHSREVLTSHPPLTTTVSSRNRANSDAPVPFERQRTLRKPSNALSNTSIPSIAHNRKSSLEMTLRDGPLPGNNAATSIATLRHTVLTSRVDATKEGMSDYRIYLWLTLLNIAPYSTDKYLALVHRGRSPVFEKIGNDVFRTLASDALFKRRVTDASLTRLLNATAWTIHDGQSNPGTDTAQEKQQALYVQGINVLSAPLLYASRSEAQAFAILNALLRHHVPAYLTPTMSGVHTGVDLIDKILAIINPTLSQYLLSKSLPAKIYAFPSVLTLCACTPPLPEVLRLWDFLFAFGTHLNILCIVAQLLLLKDTLLSSPSPSKILRSFPQLNSEDVIKMTLFVVRELPSDVYAEVVAHARL